MAWKLSESTFQIIPEGTYVFKITAVKWDEDFGKLEISLETANGYKHIERFSLLTEDGEVNEKANNAYSFFARTALNNPSLDEIEHNDLVGCYIKATVEHDKKPNRNDPAKTMTFVKLGDKEAASGFDKSATPKSTDTSNTKKSKKVNLDDLLG
nr:MAG TPA: Protein of unknown function (DUF669) [Caudoviricetes sp.]